MTAQLALVPEPEPTKKPARKPRAKKSTALRLDSALQLVKLGLPMTLAEPLFAAVSLARASESLTESMFVAWLIGHCSRYAPLKMIDTGGNCHFAIPRRDGTKSRTLFVAHTDTVHSQGGENHPQVDGHELQAGPGDECLGADNGAGLAMICHLMANKVPGHYIFTRQEEVGGQGAKTLKQDYGNLLRGFDRAITFDRRGTADVISHQGGARCASDAFAWALADELNNHGLLYMPCDGGVYTDTKEFTGYIPECTNVSVGYDCEHGSREFLDLKHYTQLGRAVLKMNFEKLPTERDPAVKEYTALNKYWGWKDDEANKLSSAEEFEIGLAEAEHGKYTTLANYLATEMGYTSNGPKSKGIEQVIANKISWRDLDAAFRMGTVLGTQHLITFIEKV